MEALSVTAAPHIHEDNGVRGMMRDVLVALVPAYLWAVYLFGLRVLFLTALSAVSSLVFDGLSSIILRRKPRFYDLSFLVTAVIFVMLLPVSVSVPAVLFGTFFAVVIVKNLFGGLGKNFLNPALAAYAALLLIDRDEVEHFTAPFSAIRVFAWQNAAGDVAASATDLQKIKSSPKALNINFYEVFSGTKAGNIGEVSAMLLLAGLLYLLVQKVVSPSIPASFLAAVFVCGLLFHGAYSPFHSAFLKTFSGTAVFGAVFLATDPVTGPVTLWGRILYGFGCGVFTVLFRFLTPFADGVSFAILLMNVPVWLCDRVFVRRFHKLLRVLKKIKIGA